MIIWVQLRMKSFPKGAGKGFDTILLCEWLDDMHSQPGGAATIEACLNCNLTWVMYVYSICVYIFINIHMYSYMGV